MCAKLLITVIAAAVVVMAMCVAAQTSIKPRYYVGFVNKTGHDLNGVSARYGNSEVAAAGRLMKAGRAIEGKLSSPIPSEAEVRWDENGTHHAVKTKLEGIVPKGFTDGTIYFILKADGAVDVKAIKLRDTEANARVVE